MLEEKKSALAAESAHTTEELVRNQNQQSSCEVKLVEIDEFRKGIVESLELEKTEIAKLLEERSIAEGFVSQPPVATGLAPKMTFEEKTSAQRVFAIRFGTGDEILSGLYDFVGNSLKLSRGKPGIATRSAAAMN